MRGTQQLYSPGYLIARWKQIEPNRCYRERRGKADSVACIITSPTRRCDARASKHSWTTGIYSNSSKKVNYELGKRANNWPHKMTSESGCALSSVAAAARRRKRHTRSSQQYYVRAQPYYYVVLLSPFVCGALLFFVAEGYVFVLFLHSWILLGTVTILSKAASVRYLQPMSFLTILIFAVLVKAMIDRRTQRTSTRRHEHLHFGSHRSYEEPFASSTYTRK